MRITKKQLFRLAFLLIGVVSVVGMLIFLNLDRVAVDNELATLDLIPKPEKLTELYFNDNANLPNAVTKQPISFAFVIHNLETTDFQYNYSVLVNVNGTRHVVDSGSVLVKNNQYFTKNEKFSLLNVRGTQDVIIELTNKRLSIDFWVRGGTK